MKYRLLIPFLFLFNFQNNSFTISGEIKNLSGTIAIHFKEYNTFQNEQTYLETIKVDSGGKFKAVLKYPPGIYQLDFADIALVNIAAESGQQIGVNISVPQNDDEKAQVEVTGSKDTRLILDYDRIREQSYNSLLKPVRREMRLAKEAGNMQRVAELAVTEAENLVKYNDDLALYAEKNFGNSIALFYAAVRLDAERHINFMEQIADYFIRNRPELALTREFKKRVERSKQLITGSKAPDIFLKSYENEPYSLSDLKGKYVLLDFWASWCMPCRVENPNYARLYARFKDKDFEIFSVSIDTNKEIWQQAARKDKISWIDVSDLNGWQSEGAIAYNVTAIPANFLLDKTGRIIAKNLRGDDLEKKLGEILN
jgi:peroxiredoxin